MFALSYTDQTPESAPSPKKRRWSGLLLRVGLTATVMGLLFWQVPWRDVVSTAAGMKPRFLIVAILLWIPHHALQFTRWAILARHAGKDATWPDIFRSYWVGFTLAVVTPGRIGQLGRCFALSNVPVVRAVGVSLLERFYAMVSWNSAGPLALAAMIFSGFFLPVGVWRVPLLTALPLIGIAVLCLGIFPRVLLPMLLWIVRRLPLREKLEQALSILDEMRGNLALGLLGISLAATTLALIQFVFLLWALGAAIPLGWGMTAVLVNLFLKLNFPISLAGLGIGEWTAIFCLTGLGVEPAAAVAGSLMLFSINILTPALLGIPVIPTLKLHRAKTTQH